MGLPENTRNMTPCVINMTCHLCADPDMFDRLHTWECIGDLYHPCRDDDHPRIRASLISHTCSILMRHAWEDIPSIPSAEYRQASDRWAIVQAICVHPSSDHQKALISLVSEDRPHTTRPLLYDVKKFIEKKYFQWKLSLHLCDPTHVQQTACVRSSLPPSIRLLRHRVTINTVITVIRCHPPRAEE